MNIEGQRVRVIFGQDLRGKIGFMHIANILSRVALLAPLLVVSGAITAAEARSESAPRQIFKHHSAPKAVQRDDALFKKTMLDSHNEARAKVNAVPLIWEDDLAEDAKKYAQYLANTGTFAHDPQTGKDPRQGENLWRGTKNAFSYTHMTKGWTDEDRFFKPGFFPDNSNSGNWADVGHYTQIIWPTTTHVGCALKSDKQDDYVVCRYSPAGNIRGRDPLTNARKPR